VNSTNVYVRTGILALLTGLMFSVGPTTVDFSLPSMPSIQHDIGTRHMRVELTLTLLLLGLTVTQFVFGAIADRYGRRRTILTAMIIYCLAALGASFAGNLVMFSVARLCQAVGFGIAVALIRSAVVDVSDERRTAGIFSTAVTIVSLVTVAAPTVGGQIFSHFGWRAVFQCMAAFGALVFVAVVLLLPETHPPERRSEVKFSDVFSTYGKLLSNRRFAAFAAIGACAAAFQFTYNTGGPTVVIEHYHFSAATAGFLFSLIAVSTAAASQLNAVLVKWLDPDRILGLAVLLSVVASAGLLVSVFTEAGGVAGLVICLFVLIATIGFIMGNSMAGAITSAGDQAGAASALVGALQFLFGTIGSGIVGLIPDIAGRTMGVVIGLLSLTAVVMLVRIRPANPQAVVADQGRTA
jgi:DHA1 family bicyclomycin/chloramphenicol resistance-like MFS transporter